MTGAKEQTYSVSYQPGPKRDPNLSYRYIVLDKNSANTLVGRGIAENFFVLQLSVVNNGDKKVAIPLSGIQAEVEWTEFSNTHDKEEFLRGPATLPPVPLAAVSGYFDAYQKVKGIRAQLFNILEAGTMVATGLVPFTGPSFKDAAVFYSGGAVPAARKAWGDLSGQQLQNITGLSWESSETLPAKGGSTEKLIYIPSKSEAVGKVKREPKEGAAPITMTEKRQITNILDVEITGFEVTESEPKQATPPATPSPTATPSAAPAPPAKSTQPGPQANSDKKQRGESP